MRDTGIVLDERPHIGSVQPPDAFEDRSRWKNNGTHTAITWVRLPSGLWVRSFNGTTSIVNIADNASLRLTNAGTILFWFKSDGAQSDYAGIIIKASTSASYSYMVYRPTIEAMRLTISTGIGDNTISLAFDYTDTVNYHFIAARWDGSFLMLSKDLIEAAPIAQTINAQANAAHACYIGRWPATSYTKGQISLARIYSYALTPAQIRKRFEATRHLFAV